MDTETVEATLDGSRCGTPTRRLNMAKKSKHQYRSWCKPCDSEARRSRRYVTPDPAASALLRQHRAVANRPTEFDDYGNAIGRIRFENGDRFTAVSESHLLALAALPVTPEPLRVYFAALAYLSPRMFAMFRRGELSEITGISTANLPRAITKAVEMCLIDALSTTTVVWVDPAQAQRGHR